MGDRMNEPGIRLVVLTGLSGSGKSIALDMFEDLDFYCIDNLPSGLVAPFLEQAASGSLSTYRQCAIALDARNLPENLGKVPALIAELRKTGLHVEIIFLDAADEVVIKRYAESRRRHPLSRKGRDLRAAIELERQLLAELHQMADLVIDTSRTSIHQLRQIIAGRVAGRESGSMALNFTSFGYKHGLPTDADFVFDARCLPNPYWEPSLRDLTGLDQPIIAYLEGHPVVGEFVDSLVSFLEPWLEAHRRQNRTYLTVALGCTGGRHRSVYIVEALARRFAPRYPDVTVRHSEIPPAT